MPGPADESAKNRYNFLRSPAAPRAASAGGVTPEYAQQLLSRVVGLKEKVEKIPSINPDIRQSNKNGVETLQDCVSIVDAQLHDVSSTLRPK